MHVSSFPMPVWRYYIIKVANQYFRKFSILGSCKNWRRIVVKKNIPVHDADSGNLMKELVPGKYGLDLAIELNFFDRWASNRCSEKQLYQQKLKNNWNLSITESWCCNKKFYVAFFEFVFTY